MKKLSFLFALLLLSFFAQAQKDSKTLVKTLDPEGATKIIFDFKHKSIDSKTWDNKGMRIQLEIRSNMPEVLLNQLVKAGRYKLEGAIENDTYIITAPNLGKTVTIGGKALEEELIVHVDAQIGTQMSGKSLSLSGGKAFSKMDMAVKFKTVCTDPSIAASAGKSKESSKMAASAAQPRRKRGEAATGNMDLQQLQSRFGEILIDGVKFEVE